MSHPRNYPYYTNTVWTDLGVEVLVAEGVNRLSIEQHLALLREVEVLQEIYTRALSTAGRSH